VKEMMQDLAEVGGEVPKDLTNSYADYEYASADAIYRHARRSLLAGGLLPFQQELSKTWHERQQGGKTVRWLEVEYGLALTPGGVAVEVRKLEKVTVVVQITGAQSMGAARTYALKYWLRGKLLLSTGDQAEDLDASEPTPLAPKPSGNFKEYVAEKKEQMAPANTWPQKEIDALLQDLTDWGVEMGRSVKEIGRSLEARYGTANLAFWTDQQLNEALERLIAAKAKQEADNG